MKSPKDPRFEALCFAILSGSLGAILFGYGGHPYVRALGAGLVGLTFFGHLIAQKLIGDHLDRR